jgi:hypothetical protein
VSASLASRPVHALRRLDRAIGRRSGTRRILVDARTPVNYTMIAPVYRAMASDARVEFFFTASEERRQLHAIYHEAPADVQLVSPAAARWMRFDAYVASDFMWQSLPRGTCRIQVYHGVGGKYGFDAPTASLRAWDRIFFVNERRLKNVIGAGAIDADSPAVRLVGLPKVDALVDDTWKRDGVLRSLGLDPSIATVLYAPTWSPNSSLNRLGLALIRALLATGVNVIVKLHDRSRDPRHRYSGGVQWAAAVASLVTGTRGVLAPGHDISPYLVAADLMITDHSSAGFEYLLRDRPIVRIHCPDLISGANIHPDYVALLAAVSESVDDVPQTVAAVERGLDTPAARGDARRAVAADLFYRPGSATARSIDQLYEAIELDPSHAVVADASHDAEALCRP